MSNKLVSSIIIFLNAEIFIEEAIASVFAQTYNYWELLLVDDGSTDKSTAIAYSYAQQYSEKVRYLEHAHHQNCGMSASRNLGIHNAKGEYIAFLDSDDVWLPQKLEQQIAILEVQPEAAIVFGPTQWWYSWRESEDLLGDSIRSIGVPPNTLIQPPKLLSLLLQNKAATPATCSVLIRRALCEDLGGFETSFRGMYEDQAFFTKVYLKATVFVTGEHWDRYRRHQNSFCAVAEKAGLYHPTDLHPAHLDLLNWIELYLLQEQVDDTEVWQALQKCLWPYRHRRLYRIWCLPQQFVRHVKRLLKLIGRRILPTPIYQKLWAQRQNYRPPRQF